MVRFRGLAVSDEPGDAKRGAPDSFFADPALDRMIAVLFNLAAESWVQEERLRRLEGITVDDDEAKRFIDRIFAPMRGI